ncbi:ATP-binding protein [Candidatus Peregrinibacteria bacterium]|nr:ATP-binding protein [Candidatus Peregrinibacteria bacterium]
MVKRKLYYKIRKLMKSREAIVITGMRQVGKTTILKQLYKDIASTNKLFFDLENPLYRRYFEFEDYEKIIQTLVELGLDKNKPAYLFLDEIQFAKSIPSFVKYAIDHYQWKFFLTGSSSFYLKNLFNESLAGRKYIFELFPFDFEEFLELKNIKGRPEKKGEISKASYLIWQKLYDEFVNWGGFPGVILKSTIVEKKRTLEDIFASYFNKEVIELGDFRNNRVIRDLMLLLLGRTGSKVDFQKFAAELGASRASIKEYIHFLEGTYFISLIYPFTKNRDVEIRSTPKVYLCDSGLVSLLSKIDDGHVFENTIFHQLRTRGKINYYQKKSGVEIDFVLNKSQSFEVKMNASARDIKRLTFLSRELALKNPQIISHNYNNLKNIKFGFQV